MSNKLKDQQMKEMALIILYAVLGFFLGGLLIYLLWNAIIPNVFPAVSTITYMQAVGLKVLVSLLFDSYSSSSKK